MKKYIKLIFLVLLFILFIGCEEVLTPEKPEVSYQPIDNGAKLRLTWTQVANADGYYIYVDGKKDTTLPSTVTTYDVSGPAKLIEVSAYRKKEESEKWSLDLTPVVSEVTVYGASDPDPNHPSGLQLTDNGAIPLAIGNQANWPNLDYIFDDRGEFAPMSIVNPGDYISPNYNDKGNAISSVASGNFDNENMAPPPNNYSTQRKNIEINGVYYLWLDRDNNGYSLDDNFGKILIKSISGARVDIKVAYQKIKGLRWVKTQ
ncbi:MAG: hypothetical protein NZ608_00230 [candidate division WOR-3 bacterium]|nr:hypothetical protein [candidate division WOR-3 bacterium]